MTISRVLSYSPDETRDIAARLAAKLAPGDVVALRGELGAGKTCFVQGLALGLGVSRKRLVNSPSFTIVKEYEGRLPLYHFDVYRLSGPAELDGIGYEEYFYGEGVTAIEWADKIEEVLPVDTIAVSLTIKGEGEREIIISTGVRGKGWKRTWFGNGHWFLSASNGGD